LSRASQKIPTADENGCFSRGARGDILLFCCKCDSSDPVLEVQMTKEGVQGHYRQFYQKGELWASAKNISVRCRCSTVIKVSLVEMVAAVEQIEKST